MCSYRSYCKLRYWIKNPIVFINNFIGYKNLKLKTFLELEFLYTDKLILVRIIFL